MTMHYVIRGIAGSFVLISLALGWLVSPWWFLFTAFVGANLLQSSMTRWCLMETILTKTGLVRTEPPGSKG
ncbi:MAG TPA: DUF2892 domain-containing protein [Longimicrobiales bacterium]|nr:DUF2892 domain-containing protein [Longimicrobiales bacterium]